MMSTRKGTKGFLLGALAGGVVGSITALLLAPKSGKDLRHDISVQAQKVGDKTAEIAGQVGSTTERIVKQIGDQTVQIANRTKQAANHVLNGGNLNLAPAASDEKLGNSEGQAVSGIETVESGETEVAAAKEL